ncbi:MAG: hypothetical protein IJW70_04475 [Clostridia bacterium]|nr:hypothetical protein [Clostridia bacterium]
MKKLFVWLLGIALLLCLAACNTEDLGVPEETTAQSETTEQAPLLCRVLLSETVYGMDGNEMTSKKYEYDMSGNLIREDSYRAGIKEASRIYTYDDNNLLVKTEFSYAQAAEAGGSTTYEYNESGQLIKECSYDYRGRQKDETVYEYDESGRMIKAQSEKSITTRTYGEHNSYIELIEDIKGKWNEKYECIYDTNGNLLSYRSYQDEEIYSERVYEYNADNQVIKLTTYKNGSVVTDTIYEYKDGLQIKSTLYRTGEVEGVFTCEYNDFGELVKELSYNAAGIATQTIIYEYGSMDKRES